MSSQSFSGSNFQPYFQSSVTTTDTRNGLLIRLFKDEADNYVASDLVGLRFGYAPSIYGALTEWWAQVSDILSMKDEELGGALLAEVLAYREALA